MVHVNRPKAAAIGVALVGTGLGAVQLISWPSATLADVFISLPFVWMAIALVYAGYWLVRNDQYREYADRVLAWTLGAAVTFGAVGVLVVLSASTPRIDQILLEPVADLLVAGALSGSLVGLYDAQSRDRFDALQAERDRIEAFANKAESLNHYGKALNQSMSVYEVSALSIEVLELLIGGRGAAVVIVDDAGASLLDSTVADSDSSFVERAAERVAERDPMTTVRYPQDLELTGPNHMDVQEIVAVPIATEGEETIVLVALPGADDYGDEDIDLLESLSAHVGTALSRVDVGAVRDELQQTPS